MATVYLAEELRHERKLAIKVLRPELSARSWSGQNANQAKANSVLLPDASRPDPS